MGGNLHLKLACDASKPFHVLLVRGDVVEEDLLQQRGTLVLCTGLSVHDHRKDSVQPETGGRRR